MVLASLFASLNAICAWLSVPVADIAFTMQTFGIFLTLGTLGGKWGSVSILIYLLLGAVGLPVFAGFQGGIGVLLGITGGYLWGFLFSGLTYWALERWGRLPAMAAGLGVCYLCGCFWCSLYAGGGWGLILLKCVLPYLIPDSIKLMLAANMAKRIRPHLK